MGKTWLLLLGSSSYYSSGLSGKRNASYYSGIANTRSLSEDELRVPFRDCGTIYGDLMGDILEGMLRFSS
jgi:hypothetical protein